MELHDQPARALFETALDTNFCVSAGAGVGKTTAIVRRIGEMAGRDPAALERLVVVTYTKSAAEELRTRARTLLLKTAGGRGSAMLPRFRQAFFGTIHSFCLKLAREYGAGLGIAPDTELLEDDEDVWARYCESPTLDAVSLDRAMLDEVTRFLSFDDILDLARKIDPGQASRLVANVRPEPHPPLDFSSSLADDGGRAKESTLANQTSLRRFLAEFEEGASFLRVPEFGKGSRTFLAAYQTEMFPFAAWLDRQAARLAAGVALGYRDYRRRQRLMTYDDQVDWCQSLLADERILEELRARDWVVLLDEAQDTDAQMFQILVEVTRPPGSAVGEWPGTHGAAGPRAGRFCFVGDEQQAIFSGRANLAVYRRYIEAYGAGLGGERLEFSVTMRCPGRVIEAVNAIFHNEDRLRQQHFAFRELRPKPECPEGAVWVLPLRPLDQERPGVDASFGHECRQVAAFLKTHGPSGLGVARWSEIAVLCPRRSWLRDAVEIFVEAGLPARFVSQQRLQLELPARSWPVSLLHVLLNPWDRFELIGVLREIFAVSDLDLASAQEGSSGLTFCSDSGLSPRLAKALAALRPLHAMTGPGAMPLSIGEWVDTVLRETCLAARLDAAGHDGGALCRLRMEALEAEAAGIPLRAWVSGLVRGLRSAAPDIASAEDDMPLMTCQKAKGLEWPVVIPLGLARPILGGRTEYPLVEEEAGEIAIHITKITVDEEAREPRKLAKREEYQRVFYVTLTRAKQLLLLPDSLRLYGKSKESFMEICRWEEAGCASFVTQIEPAASPLIP